MSKDCDEVVGYYDEELELFIKVEYIQDYALIFVQKSLECTNDFLMFYSKMFFHKIVNSLEISRDDFRKAALDFCINNGNNVSEVYKNQVADYRDIGTPGNLGKWNRDCHPYEFVYQDIKNGDDTIYMVGQRYEDDYLVGTWRKENE